MNIEKNRDLKFTVVIIMLLALLIISPSAFAAPQINSVGGLLLNGNNITITGAGFGIHEDYSPQNPDTLIRGWNNFEQGTLTKDDWAINAY